MISLLNQTELTKTGILPALVSDYILQSPSLNSLTKYPFDISAFKDVIADKANDKTNRALLVEVLQSQYANIPTSEFVSSNIQALLSENTFTVVAAHQPCLFMGPLYNIYKIASAINVCHQLKQLHSGYNFVPVFWLGSEDHDVEELNHTYINGKKIEWQNPGTGAAGRWQTATMQAAIDELKAAGANTEVINLIEEGVKHYSTFGRLTQYFVNELFKAHGLVVLDQDDARLKHLFKEIIKDEVLNARAQQVLKNNIAFLDANYKAQAKTRDINFFYLGEGYRERIIYNHQTQLFQVNNQPFSFSREQIIAEMDTHPEKFSPNVIYRPLYQEVVLPNLAFVGGAGELSYWLELKPLFDYNRVNYPILVMRNSAAIISAPVQKKLDKLGLTADAFFAEAEQLVNSYVQQNMSEDANLIKEKGALDALFEKILKKAETVDVTLKQNAAAEKQKALASLENLEGKMLKAEKRKQETTVAQIRSVHASLFPEGTLQERRQNFIPFYTATFIDEVVTELNPFDKSFKFFLNT